MNPGQYYRDLGEYLSGVGWLCSARYREVRDDAVGPAGPTLFETGMDLSDTTLGSGGGDQVRAPGWGLRFVLGTMCRCDVTDTANGYESPTLL